MTDGIKKLKKRALSAEMDFALKKQQSKSVQYFLLYCLHQKIGWTDRPKTILAVWPLWAEVTNNVKSFKTLLRKGAYNFRVHLSLVIIMLMLW